VNVKIHNSYECTIKLPASLDEVIEVIGESSTLQLINAFGGTTQRLPAMRNAVEQHEMAVIIGMEKLHQLIKAIGASRYVYIPRCADGLRQKRDREIVKRFSESNTVEQLAREYGLSDRQVWNILKKTEMDDGQTQLF